MPMALIPSQTTLSCDPRGFINPPLMAAVGRDAPNKPVDVFIVQGMLNDRLPAPHTPVPQNGTVDPGLILAIEAYQAAVMGVLPPTGRVDPGSANTHPGSDTYYSLACRPMVAPAPIAVGHVGKASPEVIEAAIESRHKWLVPASVTIAQWAVESAWGASMPPDSNNPFGIKAAPGQPAVESMTREVEDGKSVFLPQPFRKFDSLAQAFDLHGQLLASNPVYKPAMAQKDNPDAFADALTGVYATDPQYGTTLKFVIRTYGFYQYDQ
jgi:hypothetical protein